jgi:hypothetical protein
MPHNRDGRPPVLAVDCPATARLSMTAAVDRVRAALTWSLSTFQRA